MLRTTRSIAPYFVTIIGAMLEFNYDENEELKLRVYEAISRT